jgi:integrase/recombinase XerD
MPESHLPVPREAADPVIQAMEDWLAPKGPRTIRAYLQALNRLLPALPHGDLHLRPVVARQLVNEWQTQYSPATVRIMLVVARAFWTRLQAEGLVDHNPWLGIATAPPKDTRASRILTPGEVGRLIRAAGRHRVQILLLYYTGARVAEVARLRWEDIHRWEDRTHTVTLYGKGGKTREVPLPSWVWDALEDRFPQHPPTGWIFPGVQPDRPVQTETIWKNVKTVTKRAKLGKNPSPHWFRHSYASHLLAKGVDVTLVQQLLGHARLDTTATYLHLTAAQVREAGLRLDPPDVLADPD